eukprot:SAG11_NODE_13644_length_645_cov_1.417582_1_plen_24_part_10
MEHRLVQSRSASEARARALRSGAT